ncbi:PQQ-dependent sugar dehydrogenase [Luteimonas sp. SMYT11W]|uniref:PQQ-dependent sugar dehydrogenase n=1 Tax=Luteimonas flava TaxID=3115822 RepID=A0ABU7WIA6_9GAMM
MSIASPCPPLSQVTCRPFARVGIACIALLSMLLSGTAVGDTRDYRVETVAGGLDHPWSLAFLPDGRMLVTERAGRLRVIERGRNGVFALRDAPVDGVPPVLAMGQAGLFDVMVDPGFANNGLVYLSFAHGTADANHLRIVRARFDGTRLHGVTPVFTSQPAKRAGQHFGGRMALLADGTLVTAMGDGNLERTDAQRLHTHLGKTIRVHTDGRVPRDNPFVGRDGALPEIYTTGHRNPQAMVRVGNLLYSNEHGAKGGDELNAITAGANYGWPITTDGVDYTGARVTPYRTWPGITAPLTHWTPSIAPSGMAWYDGALFPAWRGSLFVSALAERSVRRVPMAGGSPGAQEILFTELGERIRDVRSGPDGALYLLTDSASGRVLRIVPAQ